MKNRPPKGILAELRGVYGKIITKLWSGKWATSSNLLKLTGQKYFDRRIRELRDEYGFDIESKNVFGEWSYRLVSKSRTSAKRMRQYPSTSERKMVIERDSIRCNICGFVPPNGKIQGFLQFDHKVPLNERGGETVTKNLQLVCIRCNVIKRRACQICILTTCNNCPYAYPEKFGRVYMIALSKNANQKYSEKANQRGIKIEKVLQEELEH